MFWRRKRSQADLDAEIRAHLDLEADDLRGEGVGDAARRARRAFGNVTALQESFYERGRWQWWDELRQDSRYAVRMLARSPMFTLTAVMTLALGIGASTATFSVVNAVLLRTLPYPNAERIMIVEPYWTNSGKGGARSSAPDFHDWRAQNHSFEAMAYHGGGEFVVMVDGVSSFVGAQLATQDFFPTFGVSPVAGRFWTAGENGAMVAVISSAWAREKFNDPAAAVGKRIKVIGKLFEVIGVAPAGFRYPGTTDVWVPRGVVEENRFRSGHNYLVVGRLRRGVDVEAARRDMRAVAARLEQEHSENRFKSVALTPLAGRTTEGAALTLWLLLGAVLVVLLIGCANVANLQLARAAVRVREMTVRSALGASRRRILRQMLTESVLLGGLGALAALVLASFTVWVLLRVAPPNLPRLEEVSIDGPVLLFALGLTLLCSLIFGFAPAYRSANANVRTGVGGRTGVFRSALMISQVALSVILLCAGGLLMRSFLALTHTDLGFLTERLLLVNLAGGKPETYRDLLVATRALPGVRHAAAFRTKPFEAVRSTVSYTFDGGPVARPGEEAGAQVQVISPGYFATMGIAVRQGRDFDEGDAWQRPQTVIVNESLAKASFSDRDPIGQVIHCGMTMESMKGMRVVGVVADARQLEPGEAPRPELFLPYLQHPGPGRGLTLLVRTELEPYTLSSSLRGLVKQINPELPVRFTTMEEVKGEALAYPRFRALLVGCFALLAASLAVIGIYGVVSYLVGQRTAEIGLRLTLGARPAQVFGFVVGGSMRLVAIGLALGLAGTLAISRVLKTLLYQVDPRDPVTMVAVVAVLSAAALLGSGIPALRAARVDPLVALRQD